MLKTSALVLIAALAMVAWVLAPGLSQSSATLHSQSKPLAPAPAGAAEPAAQTPPMRIIVPAGFDAPAGEFIGTGDHSAGEWVK
jgi:hypothetical protein